MRLAVSHEDFRAQSSLGFVHAMRGKLEQAQSSLDLAVAIRPESSDAFIGTTIAIERAIVMGWMGKVDESVAEIRRLSIKPNSLLMTKLDL